MSRLNTHVKALAREQTLVSESNAGAKKSTAGPATEAKKRKSTKGSHGVEKLKKANVSGMSKLSTFFTKKGDS